MFGNHILDEHVSSGCSHGGHIGARLNLVGDDGVGAALQPVYPPDLDDVGAGPPDVRPHGVQKVGQIHDMGLLGGVFNDGPALGQGGGQHDVHGGPYRHDIQINLPPGQAGAVGHPGVDQAVADLHLSAHGHKALDMLVYGPSAQVAAAGQGDLRPAEPAEQRAHQIVAGANLPGQLIGDLTVADMRAVHLQGGAVDHAHIGAQLAKDLKDQRDVADLRNVFDAADAIHQQSGGNDGHRGVFRSADVDGSVEGISPVNQILGQKPAPSFPCLGIYKHIRRVRHM